MAEGLLDFICPMIYSGEPELVAKRYAAAMEHANGRPVYAGLGAWQKEPEVILDEIQRIRALGGQGISFFAFWPVAEEKGYLDLIKEKAFPTPAAIPTGTGVSTRGGR